MGLKDNLSNLAEEAKGKAKEALGNATGDKDKQAEGEADQASANFKSAGENLKDGDLKGAARDAKDGLD
ncbi:CsbD family protein [Flexivirga sp. B27]